MTQTNTNIDGLGSFTDREAKKALKESGYTGKLNKMYKGEDGQTYFDMTPSYLKKMLNAKKDLEHMTKKRF